VFAQDNAMFLYIPSEETAQNYLQMRSYLRAWNNNEIEVDDLRFSALFTNYIGKDTLQSLLFESFLRFTKNKNIQNRVLKYIADNQLHTNFMNALKKLYEARQIKQKLNGKETIQYNYRNSEYDENINLFTFNESEFFNNELGLLLFENDWNIIAFNNQNQRDENSFVLMYGGGTNSMSISFRKYTNIEEREIETKFLKTVYDGRYGNKWTMTELPLEGILSRAGASRMIILQGAGPDVIDGIESGTFTVYLYNNVNRILYEVSYYMNFSEKNINYSERGRIFNFLLFQLLFVYLN
jgi:viroplasmin and RNaseH domain-containing protein